MKNKKEEKAKTELAEGEVAIIGGMMMRASLMRFKQRGGHPGWHVNITVTDNLKNLNSALKPYDEYEAELKKNAAPYLKEQTALQIQHSTVEGVLKTKQVFGVDQYDIQDYKTYEKDLTDLQEKHREIFDTYERLHNEHMENMQVKKLDFEIIYLSRENCEKELKGIQDETFNLIECIIEPRKKK